jgi:hypothetical protein
VTSAKRARQRILAALQAASSLQGVQVTYSGPVNAAEVAQEMVFLGETRADSDWSMLGALQREERYEVDLFVKTWRAEGDGSEQGAEERTWDLLAAVEDALYADPSLGGLLAGPCLEVGPWTHGTIPTTDPKGFGGSAAMTLRCTARVRRI